MPLVKKINKASITHGAKILSQGDLVAFPTETVYGLGANAKDDRAVAKIFAAKNRPSFNPLIIHVSDQNEAKKYAVFNCLAKTLATAFWPGPLTLVVPRHQQCKISILASAGLDTVALRVPANTTARRLIKVANIPIAAPSANLSGRLSPTHAQHVINQLGTEISLILDGGPCSVGLESTVIDVSNEKPVLLRLGGLPNEAIEQAIGQKLLLHTGDSGKIKSPGLLLNHYAPLLALRINAKAPRPGEVFLGFGKNANNANLNLSPTGDLLEAAANLFAYLQRLGTMPAKGIAVMPIPNKSIGLAINDRLMRAAVQSDKKSCRDKEDIN